jgi:hypothetical protein
MAISCSLFGRACVGQQTLLRELERAVGVVEPVVVMTLREHPGAGQRAAELARRRDVREEHRHALLGKKARQLAQHERARRVDHGDPAAGRR